MQKKQHEKNGNVRSNNEQHEKSNTKGTTTKTTTIARKEQQ
jgi:hypothetical protein